MGPNVKKLIIVRISHDMVPDGGGGFLSGLAAMKHLNNHAREATAWVNEAIAAVKAAPNNTYGDDEAIASEILRQIWAKKLT